MGVEGGIAIGAAVAAGSVALLGFGLDSGIEAMASVIVIWRFTGTRLASAASERRAQQLVAVSFYLLAPYIAVEAVRALVTGDRAETSIIGLVLTAGTAIFEPALGVAKRRIGSRLGSSATIGEGAQNLLCAYLAMAVFAGLAANTLLGAWWLDGVVALGIAGWAVVEGRRAWAGRSCACASECNASPVNERRGAEDTCGVEDLAARGASLGSAPPCACGAGLYHPGHRHDENCALTFCGSLLASGKPPERSTPA